jgi:hypothetical protein
VWPYATTRPLAGVLNYSPTAKTDPISNAFTVKSSYNLGYDISVYAYKQTHVVADVMGYYYDAEPEKVVAVASTGTQTTSYVVGTVFTTFVSKTVTIPTNGHVVLMGEASFRNNGAYYLGCQFLEGTTQVDFWYWDAGDSDTYIDQHQTRFFTKTVTPGTKTYWLKCYRDGGTSVNAFYRNLTIQFIKEGM